MSVSMQVIPVSIGKPRNGCLNIFFLITFIFNMYNMPNVHRGTSPMESESAGPEISMGE